MTLPPIPCIDCSKPVEFPHVVALGPSPWGDMALMCGPCIDRKTYELLGLALPTIVKVMERKAREAKR